MKNGITFTFVIGKKTGTREKNSPPCIATCIIGDNVLSASIQEAKVKFAPFLAS